MTYYRSDDTTYTISAMSLWALAEMTCVILVYCIPSFRKIVTEKNPLSNLLASWRSRSQSRSQALSSAPNLHQASEAGAKSSPQSSFAQTRSYQKIPADGVLLQDLNSWDPEAGSPAGPDVSKGDMIHARSVSSHSILRTTQFGYSAEDQDRDTMRQGTKYPVPWEQRV